MEECQKCNGRGVVLADLRSVRLGEGFMAIMNAGCRIQRNDDGSIYHEIVCPHCDGAGQAEAKGERP